MMFGTIGEPRSPLALSPNPDIIIPETLAEKFGYKKLTPEIKAKVFGLNAAKLYKIDVEAARKAIQGDKISEMREEYLQSPRLSNTQFGWVWREDSMRG
jgi:uncharacterized protein